MTHASTTPATETLEQAFARLRQRLLAYLRRRLPDAAQADDLLQDVFVKALSSQQSGRRIENLGGWLYTAVRTALADHYRAQAAPTELLDEEFPADEPEDTRMHEELALCLRPFIERLPELYRDTLLATDLDGRTMRALAEAEGVSVSAIKSRAARGRAMLKSALLDCCRVEIQAGWVSDYAQTAASDCAETCE